MVLAKLSGWYISRCKRKLSKAQEELKYAQIDLADVVQYRGWPDTIERMHQCVLRSKKKVEKAELRFKLSIAERV